MICISRNTTICIPVVVRDDPYMYMCVSVCPLEDSVSTVTVAGPWVICSGKLETDNQLTPFDRPYAWPTCVAESIASCVVKSV
jgi:hypothetical protein